MADAQAVSERILTLLDGAFEALADRDVPLSDVVARAARIARLRNDFENLQWLEMEQRPLNSKAAWEEVFDEFANHFEGPGHQALKAKFAGKYRTERRTEIPDGIETDDSKTTTLVGSVRDIEAHADSVAEMTDLGDLPADGGMRAYNEKKKVELFAARSRKSSIEVLNRIEARVRSFLSETEKQVLFGQVNADIFERNRRFVDEQLAPIAPQALEQLLAAYRRAQESGGEARSQAMLSCRRALKSVADLLCPATDRVVADDGGEEHALTDDKWVNRLIEFVKQSRASTASSDLLQTQIEELARRFKGLGEMNSRGVHADVDEFELNQAVIQTYLTIGDLLRIRADDSGAALTAQGLGGPQA